jgi:hypothetical protein
MTAASIIGAAIALVVIVQIARTAVVYFRPGDVRADIHADSKRALSNPSRLLR